MAETKKHVGRPTDYTKDLADNICERLSLGESMREIARDESMPAMSTLFKWRREIAEFSEQYERAKAEQADAFEDMMLETARTEKDVQRARLIVDTMKWTASKLKPKKYGDKVDVTSNGESVVQFINNVPRPNQTS